MKEQQFIDQHQSLWESLESQFEKAAKNAKGLRRKKVADSSDPEVFLMQYRSICVQLAIAKQRAYSPFILDRLNRLAAEGHRHLYGEYAPANNRVISFLASGFAILVRTNWRFVAVAAALFVIPLLVMGVLSFSNPQLLYSLVPPETALQYEQMYSPDASTLGAPRAADSDLAMFGFYIRNNVGIGFRTFATGVVFGLGSIFFLVFNGLNIGGVAGYLTSAGLGAQFYPFVSSHGPFELTAIVLCGAAGMKLGFALIAPGRLTRMDALRTVGADACQIALGAGIMLFFAAIIEAFWSSSSSLPAIFKYSVGAVLWLLTCLYFVCAGRGSRSAA